MAPSGTLGSGPIRRRHMGPAPQCPALVAPRHTRHEGDMKETQGGIQETKKTGRQSKSLGRENMVRPASEPSVNAPGCLTKDEDLYMERLWSASVMVAQSVCSKFFDPECVSSIPRHQDERQTGSNS